MFERYVSGGSGVLGRPAGWRTWAALAGGVLVAAAIIMAIANHPVDPPSPPAITAPVAAPAALPTAPASSPADDGAARVDRAFHQDLLGDVAAPFQAAVFVEGMGTDSRKEPIKTIRVANSNGDAHVVVWHVPATFIRVGKAVAASEFSRAREYACQLHYDLKRQDDAVTVSLSQPAGKPKDIYFARTDCTIYTTPDVRVVVVPKAGRE